MLLMSCTSHTFAETTAAQTGKALLIAIDPGHPSETSGGCAHHGLKEVDICWQVALRLEKLIAADPGLRSIKTKPQVDRLVTNRERAEIANAAGAVLMLRLHCDSGNGTGCTLYYPDRQGTVQGVTGPSDEVIAQSHLAAETMQKGLAGVLGSQLKLNPIKTDSVTYVGSKQGALTGSIFAKVPALVVEMVYLNNASDAAFIKEPAGQELLARAMLAGIKEFVSEKK
jgi:N-acetylmuramoyl-L-alanine amidase